MAKGWKPTNVDGGGASSTPYEAPLPRPTRRRRRPHTVAKEEAALYPNVVKAIAESPRVSTGVRPEPGKYGQSRATDRVAVGVRWSKIVTAVKAGEYTWQEFCEGLDEQELARGQLRASDGTFTGRPPSFVPREFLLACQRDQKRRFEEIFGSEVIGIAKQYVKLCQDAEIPVKDRAKMMQYAMERIFGGIPKDIRVSQEQPWEQMIVNVTSDGEDGMAEHRRRRYAGYQERQGGGADVE
jgi:hypothetical protein